MSISSWKLLIIITMSLSLGQITYAAGQRIALSLHTPDITRIVKPGQERSTYLSVENRKSNRQLGRLSLIVEDLDETECKVNNALELTSSERRRVYIPKAVFARRGIKWVRAKFTSQDNDKVELTASFAYMTPAADALIGRREDPASMRFGIAYGASADNISQIAAQRVAAIGVNTLRANPYWHRAQPKADVWDWRHTDQLVSTHGAYGIELQPLVSGSARWAVPVGPDGKRGGQSSAPDPEAWRHWIRNLAGHLKGRARYWEIWNEPDIGFFSGTQEQYVEMLRIAYEEIKKVDPNMVCMTGGFVAMDHHGRKPYMIQRVLLECQDSYDAIAYHTHGYFNRFREEIDTRLLPYCSKALRQPKRLYFTETGMDTRQGQRFQAETLPKKMVFAWSRGAIAYTWFNLHDMQQAKRDNQPGFTYGLFTKWKRKPDASGWGPNDVDYSATWPKAAYVAFNTTATALRGLRFREQADLNEDQYVFLFDGKGQQALVAWQETSGSASFHGIVSCEGDIRLVDLMGNETPLAKTGNRAVFKAGKAPVFICSKSRHPIRFGGVLVESVGRTHVVPGEPADVTIALTNPLSQKVNVSLQWNSDSVSFLDKSVEEATIGPRQTLRITQRILLPSTRSDLALGESLDCVLDTEFEGTPWRSKTRLPISVGGILIDRGLPRRPSIQLRDIGHVVNLSEHDPHTVHLLWNGPKDLSLSAKLARTTNGVLLEAVIEDDVLFAPEQMSLDEADCLQLTMRPPDSARTYLITVGGTPGRPRIHTAVLDGTEASPLDVDLRVEDNRRIYRLNLPDASFGWSDVLLRKKGIQFNIGARDNDGRGLKGWIQLAPGLGEIPKGSEKWVRAVLK